MRWTVGRNGPDGPLDLGLGFDGMRSAEFPPKGANLAGSFLYRRPGFGGAGTVSRACCLLTTTVPGHSDNGRDFSSHPLAAGSPLGPSSRAGARLTRRIPEKQADHSACTDPTPANGSDGSQMAIRLEVAL